jgi:hypothetical protein
MMAMTDLVDHYRALVSTGPLPIAACWTVVQPLAGAITVEDVVCRLGADPSDLEVLDLNEAYEVGPHDGWILHVDQVGNGVTIFENNGFQGARSEVLQPLSVDARVHSAFWNVNMVTRLSYAHDGHVVAAMEAGAVVAGPAPDALDSQLVDLLETMRTPGLVLVGMLAAVERLTGVRLDADWFTRPHEAIMIGAI